MDNQPMQPGGRFGNRRPLTGGPQPNGDAPQFNNNAQSPAPTSQPMSNPGNYTNPSTPVNTSTGDIVLPAGAQKKRKGLLIGLICFLAVLLIGGGAFAAVYLINNQPNNIAASAFNNLLNAKQVGIDGSVKASLPASNNNNSNTLSVSSVTVDFNEQAGLNGNSTTATATIGFNNGITGSINLGEVMLKNGVFYIEADGIKQLYHETLHDTIHDYLVSVLQQNSGYTTTTSCVEVYGNDITSSEYLNCLSTVDETVAQDPTTTNAAVDQIIDQLMVQIDGIIEPIDGQWIEFSFPDILDSEIISANLSASTRQSILKTYNCSIDTMNNLSNYSPELSELYSQSPFLTLTSGQDSFYDLSLNSTNLANYLNALPKTKLYSDLATCNGVTIPDDAGYNITAESIDSGLKYLPQISAKFDGFLDHHLTDLKVNQSNDYYSVSANLHFTYPDSVNVEAPTNTRPVMDIVDEVYQKLTKLYSVNTVTVYTF